MQDLSIYPTITNRIEVPTPSCLFDFNHKSGMFSAGMYRLVQKFILELLTIRGTVRYRPLRGCYFMSELQIGNPMSPIQVFGAFSRALLIVKQNLQSIEYETDPPIERFREAVLERVNVVNDSVILDITVKSDSDETATFTLPVV